MLKVKSFKLLSRILAGLVVLSPLNALGVPSLELGGVVAPGHVFYKTTAGEMVKRELNLTVPSQGDGPITLSTEQWSTATTHFFSKEVAGRIVFTIVFVKPYPEQTESSLVLSGSYMRGSNLAVYWGDLYKTKTTLTEPMIRMLELTQLSPLASPFLYHVGGFKFKADITPDAPSEPSPSPTPTDSFFIP